MKTLLLCLLLASCATESRPRIERCAIAPIGQADDVTIVVMHCEPEGTKI